jgi:hypothetical protein
MSVRSPFQPQRGANQVVSPSATSASTTVAAGQKSVRLVNSGANICYVRVGGPVVAATTADTPVLPNSALIVEKQQDDVNISYISALGTTLNIQPGEGGFI